MPVTPLNEPAWLSYALQFSGLREVKGPGTNPVIARWLRQINAEWLNGDDDPWCGVGMGAWMLGVGIAPPRAPYRAANWATWGIPLVEPVYGCVGVLKRPGGHHVTLIMGQTRDGSLLGHGANQSDEVRISRFNRGDFIAFRWPQGVEFKYSGLPIGTAESVGSMA